MINYLFRDSSKSEKFKQLYNTLSNKVKRPFSKYVYSKMLDYISPDIQYTVKSVSKKEFIKQVYNGYEFSNEEEKVVNYVHRRETCIIYGDIEVGYKQKENFIKKTEILDNYVEHVALLFDTKKGYNTQNRQAFQERSYTILIFMDGGGSDETVQS